MTIHLTSLSLPIQHNTCHPKDNSVHQLYHVPTHASEFSTCFLSKTDTFGLLYAWLISIHHLVFSKTLFPLRKFPWPPSLHPSLVYCRLSMFPWQTVFCCTYHNVLQFSLYLSLSSWGQGLHFLYHFIPSL